MNEDNEWDRRKEDLKWKETVVQKLDENTKITTDVRVTLATYCEKTCNMEKEIAAITDKEVPKLKNRLAIVERALWIAIGGTIAILFFVKLMHLEKLF